ncbi:MAG: lamin tail domain-containing protein, partial [Candidatus Cloacimonetes bacterium]|nr:lamin tail domain-containing protein [Candidatus Cloacimonadota bacterium]
MKIQSIMILILISTSTILSAQATNLIISEYVEGTSYQKAIEIFNGTGAPVDLSTVSLKKQTNGAGAFGSELVLSGTLANNDVFVIVNSSTGGTNLVGQPFVDLATTSQAVNFNGNDAVALFRNGVMIDVVGIVDQVENWGYDATFVRNSNVASPTTNFNMTEWAAHSVNTFSYLGTHTFTGGSTDPIIIVSNPNNAVTWYLGQTYNIEWS